MKRDIFEICDLWENLKKTKKPILLYGMGDGADKVLDVCSSKGIEVSGVFASDSFAKHKIFRGFDVSPLSETLVKFEDPIILLSFASCLDDVMNNVKSIASKYELYCPDVPVFGTGLFDRKFVFENFDHFNEVYSSLSDDLSRSNYVNLILGKMTGNIDYLVSAETPVSEAYQNIIKPSVNNHYVDIGAYNGDTIREYLSYAQGFSKITAFEPDVKNYNKLCKYAEENNIPPENLHNIAAWNKCELLTFYSRSGRNSAGSTSHKSAKSTVIQADTADSRITDKVDFINIDAEGSDMQVIEGLKNTIANYKPTISCALYHRNEDMFSIPIQLKKMYGDCEMYIRHFKYFPAWDTNVYVKPKI